MTVPQVAAGCLAGIGAAAHRFYLGKGCKVGGHALGGFAHHPTGFIIAAKLCIQSHPVPVACKGYSLEYIAGGFHEEDTRAVTREGLGRHVGKQRGGQGNQKVEVPLTGQRLTEHYTQTSTF